MILGKEKGDKKFSRYQNYVFEYSDLGLEWCNVIKDKHLGLVDMEFQDEKI